MNASCKPVSSAANPLVKKMRALSMKKYRDADGIFMVEGLRHIREAFVAGWTAEIVAIAPHAAGDREVALVLQTCAQQGGTCISLTPELMQRVTGRDNAQDVVAVFRQQWHALSDAGNIITGLENIRDPGNLGTIIRTADAAGAETVLLVGNTCDPYSPEAVRASMGSFARMTFIRADFATFLDWRRTWKGRVIGTSLDTDTDYRAADYTAPLLLMMGGEKDGLSADMTAACDTLVKIPMRDTAESLNIAVATGIMLYEVFRGK